MNRNQNNYFYKDGISKSILFIQSPLAFASIVTSHDISDKERPVDNFISRERDLSQSFITILIVTGEVFFLLYCCWCFLFFSPCLKAVLCSSSALLTLQWLPEAAAQGRLCALGSLLRSSIVEHRTAPISDFWLSGSHLDRSQDIFLFQ